MGEEIKNDKVMNCISSNTIREIVEFANSIHLQKEDVVSLISKETKYYLVYYGSR